MMAGAWVASAAALLFAGADRYEPAYGPVRFVQSDMTGIGARSGPTSEPTRDADEPPFGSNRIMALEGETLTVPEVVEDEDAGEGAVPAPETVEGRVVPADVGRFAYPVERWTRVTDRFGAHRGEGFRHGGIDLAIGGTLSRSPIYASCNGTVSVSTYSSTYGNYVVVDCGEGWATLYAHMSEVYVSRGDRVTQSDVLGRSGSTGFSTGEHLHFEIIHNGLRVNPEHYLDFNIPPGTPLSSGPLLVRDNSGSDIPRVGTGWSGLPAGAGGGSSTPAPKTPAPSATATTPTATPTATPTQATPSATPTEAPSPTARATPTATATPEPTETPTPETPTPPPTATPVETPLISAATAIPTLSPD